MAVEVAVDDDDDDGGAGEVTALEVGFDFRNTFEHRVVEQHEVDVELRASAYDDERQRVDVVGVADAFVVVDGDVNHYSDHNTEHFVCDYASGQEDSTLRDCLPRLWIDHPDNNSLLEHNTEAYDNPHAFETCHHY